ncbi:MAG: OsmC family protein [Candidatus Binataceae bacterium]
MADRYIKPSVKTVSTGIPGRHIWNARHNQLVIDDSAGHGGPGDAPGAGELFLAGITGCATLMMERLAHHSKAPLTRVEVTMDGVIDTEAPHEGPAVFQSARMEFVMAGVSEAQAHEMVETYKHY